MMHAIWCLPFPVFRIGITWFDRISIWVGQRRLRCGMGLIHFGGRQRRFLTFGLGAVGCADACCGISGPRPASRLIRFVKERRAFGPSVGGVVPTLLVAYLSGNFCRYARLCQPFLLNNTTDYCKKTACADMNLGWPQCGRDNGRDTEGDLRRLHAERRVHQRRTGQSVGRRENLHTRRSRRARQYREARISSVASRSLVVFLLGTVCSIT
jgi:hypothetical protein